MKNGFGSYDYDLNPNESIFSKVGGLLKMIRFLLAFSFFYEIANLIPYGEILYQQHTHTHTDRKKRHGTRTYTFFSLFEQFLFPGGHFCLYQ